MAHEGDSDTQQLSSGHEGTRWDTTGHDWTQNGSLCVTQWDTKGHNHLNLGLDGGDTTGHNTMAHSGTLCYTIRHDRTGRNTMGHNGTQQMGHDGTQRRNLEDWRRHGGTQHVGT